MSNSISAIFDEASVAAWMDAFVSVLDKATNDPDLPLSQLVGPFRREVGIT